MLDNCSTSLFYIHSIKQIEFTVRSGHNMQGLNQSELHHVTNLSVSHYTFEFYTATATTYCEEAYIPNGQIHSFPSCFSCINILVYILISVKSGYA